ncbi:hypothetical protein MGL_2398 [Malassezia globosa CBS 7966]|uniref:NADH-ubiquinone oxidoreductase 21kDa subunit N-terminal domain-containing protein n=1 Tax=Malassezia globosa (strain ATCC MYA-4612 / CBS 7966) TaxID=425265 RepID=A8Q3H0_MALGO|nr:uncharacterized protein MGL_2398 [Malassezia globosa CBS 7966]EDP43388.1 hypothetical protein MGL_2398 [Malassezia globosa CBS 7966]
MPQKEFETEFPLIDSDPHFRRVVRYFRPSDYYAIAGTAVAFPSALWLLESSDPARGRGKLGAALKLSTFLGLCGGFLYAYQRSTFRFWGWTENAREQELAKAEVASGDVPGQGKSSLTDELQGVAHRNSAFSQLNLGTSVLFRVGAFCSAPCCLYTD